MSVRSSVEIGRELVADLTFFHAMHPVIEAGNDPHSNLPERFHEMHYIIAERETELRKAIKRETTS